MGETGRSVVRASRRVAGVPEASAPGVGVVFDSDAWLIVITRMVSDPRTRE
jgi:hypothetical protein